MDPYLLRRVVGSRWCNQACSLFLETEKKYKKLGDRVAKY
jgi:hypothetical protein